MKSLKFWAIIAFVIFVLGYLSGSKDKKEVLDGLVHTIMVCNTK